MALRTRTEHSALAASPPPRLRSVDVFRGLTVALMVIVNNPGDWGHVYWPLLHAEWHGVTPTDLVFPFFLFIVGVAIALSPATNGSLVLVIRRGVVIFALGLFLAGFPRFPLTTWRIPGVLQRIAICYVAAVLIVRAVESRSEDARRVLRRLTWVIAVIVLAYAALLLVWPVPGGHAGDLSAAGNLGAWLDRQLMRGHLWKPDWDPEGLLSTLPAVGTTLMGVVAGQALELAGDRRRWRRQLAASGLGCMTLGLAWHPWFPMNKSLWTSSYVFFTGGVAAVVLALCSWAVDGTRAGWRARVSEPFVALGRNAILLFVLSGLTARLMGIVVVNPANGQTLKGWIYATLFAPVANPINASLLFAFANLAALYALLAWLHRHRWYWRV